MSQTSTIEPSVISEIQSGSGLSLAAVGRTLPGHRGNSSIDPATVFRWMKSGTRAANGAVVRLEAVRVGGRWVTSREAVARFIAASTTASSTDCPAPSPRPSGNATQRAAAANKRLEAIGA